MSVNITGGIVNASGIIKDRILYDKPNYFHDGDTIWGCPCNIKKCIKKCCGPNKKISNDECVENLENFRFDVYRETNFSDEVKSNDFHFVYSKICRENFVSFNPDFPEDLFVQENGSLLVQSFEKLYEPEDYCIDVFDNVTFAYLCEFHQKDDKGAQILGYGKIWNI